MDFVPGHVVRDQLPAECRHDRGPRQAMTSALVDTLLAASTRSGPDDVGLGDFGRPEGFLERQVRRWWQQWEASKTRDLPAIESCIAASSKSVPMQSPPGIVHGDYRFDNVIYAPDDPPRIAAVVDWEMSTVGDPLCDLGLLACTG